MLTKSCLGFFSHCSPSNTGKYKVSSDVTVKIFDKPHLHEHEIEILCLRLKITQGRKKQQLSQPFHVKMQINLRSKREDGKEREQCKSKTRTVP